MREGAQMLKLDRTRLMPTGDHARQFDEDCGAGKADFEAAAAELRGLGQIAKRQPLTAAEAAAFDDALARVSRQYDHLVRYARALPQIARSRHQQSSPKGPNREASELLQGVIKAEFLAWRRKQPTQWGYDYSPRRSNSPFGGFAAEVSRHFADKGIEVSPRSIINHTGAWLNEVI